MGGKYDIRNVLKEYPLDFNKIETCELILTFIHFTINLE